MSSSDGRNKDASSSPLADMSRRPSGTTIRQKLATAGLIAIFLVTGASSAYHLWVRVTGD